VVARFAVAGVPMDSLEIVEGVATLSSKQSPYIPTLLRGTLNVVGNCVDSDGDGGVANVSFWKGETRSGVYG
jgi:hypothetical protein